MYSNKEIWNVSYPIFLSLLAQNIINVTDTAFLGRLGEVELGASAMGGLYYICLFTVAFGFSTGSQIVIARRNGEKQYASIGPVMIQGVFFLFAAALLVLGFSLLCGRGVMGILISSDAVLEASLDFLNIRVFGFIFSFANVMFRALYVGIARTKVLTFNAVLMALTNVVLDYLLIFGHGGFPAMGIQGAAIASVIAEAVSIGFFLVYTRLTVDIKKYGLNKFRSFDFTLLKRVLNISIYTMMQHFVSMSTFFLFFIAVERIGQRELAVANIVRSIYIIMFIPVNSLSAAVNTFVSNAMGAKRVDQVMPTIRKIAKISLLIMSVCALVVCLMPRLIVSIYTNNPDLINESVPAVYVISAAMLICSVSNVYFNGVSGTGNTRPAFAMEIVVLILYCIHISVFAILLKMPVYICFTSEIVYYGGLLILCMIYLKKAAWYKKRI